MPGQHDIETHGRCTFCQAPLCFGPYECCAMFGQHTKGALVVIGQRLSGLEVCRHPQCAMLARTSERLTLDRLVDGVAAQLIAVPWPNAEQLPFGVSHGQRIVPESVLRWARDRAKNIVTALQPDLRITPVSAARVKPVGHGWSCRCRDCGAADVTARAR